MKKKKKEKKKTPRIPLYNKKKKSGCEDKQKKSSSNKEQKGGNKISGWVSLSDIKGKNTQLTAMAKKKKDEIRWAYSSLEKEKKNYFFYITENAEYLPRMLNLIFTSLLAQAFSCA